MANTEAFLAMGVAKHLIASQGLGRANLVLKKSAGLLVASVGVYIVCANA